MCKGRLIRRLLMLDWNVVDLNLLEMYIHSRGISHCSFDLDLDLDLLLKDYHQLWFLFGALFCASLRVGCIYRYKPKMGRFTMKQSLFWHLCHHLVHGNL